MKKKSLFIKMDKHTEVNNLIQKIESIKENTRQKLEALNEITIKEKEIIQNFEESLKKADSYTEEINNLLNTE